MGQEAAVSPSLAPEISMENVPDTQTPPGGKREKTGVFCFGVLWKSCQNVIKLFELGNLLKVLLRYQFPWLSMNRMNTFLRRPQKPV